MDKEQNSEKKARKRKTNTNRLYRNDLTEMVFEERNKAFGGYILRREYSKRLLVASGIAILLLLFLTIPQGISYLWPKKSDNIIIEDSIIEIPMGGPDYALDVKPPPPESTVENERLEPEPVKKQDSTDKNKQTKDTTQTKKNQPDNNNKQANGQVNGQNNSTNNGGAGGPGNDANGKLHADILNKKELRKLMVIEYPAEEKILGHEDVIIVGWQVHEDGSCSDYVITKSKGYKKLNEAAIKIAQKAHCIPAQVNGVPKREAISIPVTFRQ